MEELSQAQEQLLRAQTIDAVQPGTVLRNFAMVLDFVGPKGVAAAGKYNLLPISAIDELDQRLSRPLRLPLQRPKLNSHPYLLGLHLLLRATGLTRVEGPAAKARLVVPADALERWQALNPTEQYFNLLEAALRIGSAEMVGERGSSWDTLLNKCLQTWRQTPRQGYRLNLEKPTQAFIPGAWRDYYLIALMDLFGLMRVEHPKKPVKPWIPASVHHLPFGDAVFTLLYSQLFIEDDPDAASVNELGRWQPLFEPYFPQWQKSLTLPEAEGRKGTFVFRVALGKMWRRIAIAADDNLESLAHAILDSVDFDFDHLYEFIYRDRFGATVRAAHPFSDEGPWSSDIHIGDLPLETGQTMNFHYDFGDDWRFNVKLESVEPASGKFKKPRVLEKSGKAPRQYESSDW